MKTKILETRSLIGIVSSARLEDAAKLMATRDIGALGVYASNARDLVGVVTERDLTHALARGLDPTETCLTEVMTGSPVVVEGPITSSEAGRVMHERHVRHIIVKQAGSDRILSIRDL